MHNIYSNTPNLPYTEALEFLYSQLPMFSRVGAAAYKPGLERVIRLSEIFGNPERKFKSIHIAGTNGKGSVSHMLASVLQAHGYRTALYTSPHLVDFRERIRIDGDMIPEERVVEFVNRWRGHDHGCDPSFFELTMMLAFDWFAEEGVDYAVIEVGMGGRLDSTNIITPLASVITNISFDHTQFLGDTLPKIAAEKAGIMKAGIPVIIGEADTETESVFRQHAQDVGCMITEAYRRPLVTAFRQNPEWGWDCESPLIGNFHLPLAGEYQKKNINTLLNSIDVLIKNGVPLEQEKITEGIEKVEINTGLRGRWTRLGSDPLVICDTGHNEAGLRHNTTQLTHLLEKRASQSSTNPHLHIVMGFVADKDVEHILPLFPKDAVYYITAARIPRAMKAGNLAELCAKAGLNGSTYPDTAAAYSAAKAAASPADIIFIGGSTFIVADLLASLQQHTRSS